ncbi:MAG: glycosyltransferase [Opitutae bacterium]|nr:glycosyltransferase [Opitutae bacterium]
MSSLVFAALTLALWLGAAWEVMRGNRRMKSLARLTPPESARWPRVSVVFAARNEGRTVGAAVPTMLALDYPDLELIAVDDRSEDDTGAVLDRLAAADPRLRVDHIRELPPGWIGKNHALHHGAAQSTGEWILFTDADIHFRADALRRAVAHARAQQLDHLSAVPQLHERGALLGICVGAFSLLFALFVRPWCIPDPRSRCHGGVGAFNLVRASTYRKLGGHEPLRLRPDDDLKLGKLMKSGGFSEMVLGAGVITVEWYASVGGLVRGLTKNAFAGADYRAGLVLLAVLLHTVFFLGPVAALFFTHGLAWQLDCAAVLVMLLVAADNQRFDGGRPWHGLFFPVGLVVFDYILLRSMSVTIMQRGITWRGTHYPLRELKANRL